jgi:hypothetical protein
MLYKLPVGMVNVLGKAGKPKDISGSVVWALSLGHVIEPRTGSFRINQAGTHGVDENSSTTGSKRVLSSGNFHRSDLSDF